MFCVDWCSGGTLDPELGIAVCRIQSLEVRTYLCMCLYVCACVCVRVCVSTFVCVYVYVFTSSYYSCAILDFFFPHSRCDWSWSWTANIIEITIVWNAISFVYYSVNQSCLSGIIIYWLWLWLLSYFICCFSFTSWQKNKILQKLYKILISVSFTTILVPIIIVNNC